MIGPAKYSLVGGRHGSGVARSWEISVPRAVLEAAPGNRWVAV